MEQTTPTSSKDAAGGNCHMFSNNRSLQQTNVADGRQSIPIFQGRCSMGASHYRSVSHFHPSTIPFSHAFEGDGCSTHTPSHMKDLHHPSSLYGRHVSGMVNHDTLHIPDFLPAPSCTSPEGLLEIILVAQQKLQQLQAIVELMVRVGGQGHEHQSLASGVKSIMSQLFAATACLRQDPSDQVSSLAGASEGVDFRSDSFYNSGSSFSTGQVSRSSSMKLFCMRGVETRTPFLLNDVELQPQAMESVLSKSADVSRPFGETDLRFNKQGQHVLLDDPSNYLAHSKTGTDETFHIECNADVANGNQEAEDHEFLTRDDDDDGEGESLPPGSYELVEMAAAEILAEHTHFCELCGKGFKRDANLRMHMRGHGDEYKTPAALAKPDKSSGCAMVVKPRRYSCPFLGCKRNKQHKKFQPLKTTLCVKNHYRRSHCPKLLTCSKCKTKKFSVVADLKTHEKHCGQDKWQCSCGTTFSRKDKLMGHVNLFAGHAPMVSSSELESLNGHGEPQCDSLTANSVEHLECLGGSKTILSTLSGGGLALSTTFNSANNINGTSMSDLTDMGDEIFMGDEIDQQRAMLHGETCFFVSNS